MWEGDADSECSSSGSVLQVQLDMFDKPTTSFPFDSVISDLGGLSFAIPVLLHSERVPELEASLPGSPPPSLVAPWARNEMTPPDEVIVPNLEGAAYMKLALEQAEFALDSLEVPVGCVLIEDQKVISFGRNRTNETRNATRHAEMEAIDMLLEQWQKDGVTRAEVSLRFSKCTLYVTCEPCIMCAATLSIIGIKEVYFGCANDKFGGCGSILSLHTNSSGELASGGISQRKGFKCTGGLMASEAINLLRSFYEQGNPNAPKPHRTPVPQF